MHSARLPFTDKAFDTLLARAAKFSGAPSAADLLEKLHELGAMEALDWFLLRDLTTLCKVDAPEAVLLLILLLRSRNLGSLCLSLAPERLQEQLTEHQAKSILDWLKNAPKNFISQQPITAAPLVLDPKSGLLYFQRLFLAETALKEILTKRMAAETILPEPIQLAAILTDVLEKNPPWLGKEPVRLNPEQTTAILCGLSHPLSLITGGPGTGKTALVAALLRCLVRMGVKAESIRLAAPTGRAASRLSDAVLATLASVKSKTAADESITAITSSTIHKLLSYSQKTGSFRHNKKKPFSFDVLIVDEASMISADLMAALLEALPANCRLILIGDKDQLPSVDAGSVLADLLPPEPAFSASFAQHLKRCTGISITPKQGGRFQDRAVFLTKSYRSQAPILEFAAAVNRGEAAAASSLQLFTPGEGTTVWARLDKAGNCLRIDPPDTSGRKTLLLAWIQERMMERGGEIASWSDLLGKIAISDAEDLPLSTPCRDLFTRLSQARILTALRHGPLGCETVNRILISQFKKEFDPNREGHLFHGLPILITENDPGKKLFNGDVGLVIRCKGVSGRPSYRVIFDRPDRLPVFTPDELPAWEPAFAITVHKSQGSEYGEILLLLPENSAHTLNTREILYTGVTRGKERAVVVGTQEVIKSAVLTPSRRESGLGIWSREEA